MPRIEFLKFLGRRNKAELTPALDKTAQITQIALDAQKIWFDRRIKDKDRESCYKAEAEKLLGFMTPELLNDPNFYGGLDPKTHIRVLELLSIFIPDVKPEKFESIPGNVVIVSYLKGLVRHKGLISEEQNGDDVLYVDYDDSAVRIIRSEPTIKMPKYYLDSIFREDVGLPPKHDRPGVRLEKKYEHVVRAPGEQRRPKIQ